MSPKLNIGQLGVYPRPGLEAPKAFDFAPDGKTLYYLDSPSRSLYQQLWSHDLTANTRQTLTPPYFGLQPDDPLSRYEELRRERLRQRDFGVTDYEVGQSASGRVILMRIAGRLYLRHGDEPIRELTQFAGVQDARLSPDGNQLALVLDGDLYVADNQGNNLRRLTHDAADGLTNGLAGYIAEESLGRHDGFWWSRDGRFIAYTQVDTRHIPPYYIPHQGLDGSLLETDVRRYPFPGAALEKLRLGVVAADGGETVWCDLSDYAELYITKVSWGNEQVAAEILTRDHRKLTLYTFDPATGTATKLIEDSGEPWLNHDGCTRFLKSGEILWASEQSGYRHLYLYRDGQRRALTSGDWLITDLAGLDEANRTVYFRATKDGVTERHLYSVSLDGGEVRRITTEAGWHNITFSPDFSQFVDSWSSLDQPTVVALKNTADGATVLTLHKCPNEFDLPAPELCSFANRDGVTLHATLYLPPALDPTRRYPLVVAVYGGPHSQRVMNSWDVTADLRPQYLAQAGFIVLKVDNRGSANRGIAFEGAVARNLGDLEIRDQVDGVRELAKRPYVDSARVGIYGWSYGGYATLMALLRAPDVFKVGVAGAPVTDWRFYDSGYTECYMSTPDANPGGYEVSRVLTHLANLRGRLLLVHGLVDENVHFRHTANLIMALSAANLPYDLVVLPEDRHMVKTPAMLDYQERRTVDYFLQHL
jgi:dipeptidyl-peptidase 4